MNKPGASMLLLFVLLFSNYPTQAYGNVSPGVTACQEHKYFTAVRYWESRRASGAKLDPAEQILMGCAYANLAILADKAFPVECEMVAEYAGFYKNAQQCGGTLMMRGLALFGEGNRLEAQKVFGKIPAGDSLRVQADFWSQMCRSPQAVPEDQVKNKEDVQADACLARWILDKSNYPDLVGTKSGWWSGHLTALNQLKKGEAPAAEKTLLEILGKPRTFFLSSRDTVMLYNPFDLLVARSVYCQLALQDLESVVQAGKADDNARYFLGYIYYLLGQYPKAEAQFQGIKDPDLGALAQVYQADCWNHNGKFEQARGKWEGLLKSKIEFARGEAALFLHLSGVQPDKGKTALLELCRRPHSKDDPRPKVDQQCYQNLAQIYMAEGDYETALRYLYERYTRGGDVLDNRLPYLLTCVECQFKRGAMEYQNCQEILYFLWKEYPFLRSMHQTLALIYARSLTGKSAHDQRGE